MKNNYTTHIKKITLIIGLFFTLGTLSAQTTVFSDQFTSSTGSSFSTAGAIGSSTVWSLSKSGDDWGAKIDGGKMELTNDASGTGNVNGWIFGYFDNNTASSPWTSTLSSNTGIVTWEFNMRQIRTDPAGFGSGSYGVAFILAGTSVTAATAGNGYAVVLGQSGSIDALRLVSYTTGLQGTLTNMITSNTIGLTDFGANYLSVRITYDPATNTWGFLLRDDGSSAFSDPTSGTLVSQGTVINSTYTSTANLRYTGGFWQGSTAANQTAFFDNVYLKVSSVACAAPTTQASAITLGGITNTAMDVNWTNGGGAGRVVLMNTSNSFTAPTDGSNPTANLTYGGSGEQCIFNGTGSGPITVTGLTASTQYYYRVYEYCSPDRNYQTSTASNNPNNATTTSSGSPSLSASALTAFGSQCVAGTYGPNSFTITGSSLTTANVTVAALSGYTYSTTSGGSYTSTLSLTQPGGAYSQDIYVKFTPASAIAYNGNIVVGGGGASNINVAASGTGINGTVAVTTETATSILTTSASSGGSSLSTTCGTITAKGVVWGTAANPTVPSVNSTNDGTGTSNYSSNITGLTNGTTYNYRAYATNSNGVTSYGTNLTFVTLKLEPSNYPTAFNCGTTTTSTIPLTWTAATGAVLPDGYLIKWSATSYAAIADPLEGSPESNGATTQNVVGTSYTATGLTMGTTYYFKIWSYTNSGSSIDYKLTSEPQTSCATLTGPCLEESFESLTPPPAGWTYTGVAHSANNPRTGSRDAMFNDNNEAIVSPLIASPSTVSFWWRRSGSSPGSPEFKVSVGPSTTGPWTQVGSTITSFTTTYQQFFEDISSYTNIYIQVLHNRTSGTNEVYVDDFEVNCSAVCAAPTSTATLTSSAIGTAGADFAWTGASGDGTMLVVRATANSNLAPSSGASYTANTNFATAGQININNRVVFRGSGSSVTGITGLSAETQYTSTAYNYNDLDNCYQLALPANTSFYTLSLQPSAHAASFTSSAFAYNQINLTFSAASTLSNADGYIILQRTAAAPTGLPSNATGYAVGNAIGDATVAAIITNTATTTASITGLTGSTQYYFTLIPFNWNTSIAATYNYRTAATIPLTNATTLIQPSTSSDIIANATYTYNSNIDYLTHQIATITNTGNSIDLFKFDIRDGGAGTDADMLPTILNAITFNVTNIDNIRTAALFNGNSLVNNAPTINYGGGTIAFSGLSGANVTAGDGLTNSLTLRVSWKAVVLDNSQMEITIAAANCTAAGSSSSSLFSAFTTVNSSLTGDRNRLEVTADRIAFTTQPTNQGVSVNLASFTIQAVDINGNVDLDASKTIALTTSGVNMTSSSPYALTSGTLTISDVQYTTAPQTGITLTATTTGYTDNDDVSSTFNITDVAINTYRTTNGGTWPIGTATWEKYDGSTWIVATPAANTTNLLIIRHIVTSRASFAAPSPNYTSMTVENGGSFIDGHNSTFGMLLVKSGGKFTLNDPAVDVASTGTLTVDSGGTVVINSSTFNHADCFFCGTENFKAGSTVEIQQYDNDSSPGEDDLIESLNPISLNADGYYFGNLFINMAFSLPANNKAMTLVGITGTQKLCKNNLTIANQEASEQIQMTNVSANVEVGGNLLITKNKFGFGTLSGSNVIHTIKGNITVNGATAIMEMNSTSSGTASVSVNLEGDLIGIAGTMKSTDGGCSIAFTNTALQNIDIVNAVTFDNISVYVRNLANVQLLNNDFKLNSNSSFTVENGGTFNFSWAADGTTPLKISNGASGSNLFNSNEGSTLKITSPQGIVKTVANSGNVQLTVSNKNFNNVATFHYIGKANQVTGDAMISASSAKIVICELDQNSYTLTPSNSIAMSNTATLDLLGGRLEIRKGIVIETPSATITGTGRLVMTDGTFRTSILATTLPQLSNYSNYSLTGGTVELNGNGAQIISGAPNGGYYNLAVTNAGTKSVTSGFSIANNLLITAGIFDPTNNGIIGNAGITMTGGRFRMSILNQTLPQLTGIATPYALSGGTIELYGTTNAQTQSLRGTYGTGPSTVSYFNVDLNSTGANVLPASANVVAGAGFGVAGVMTVFSPTCFQLGSGFIINDAGTTSTFDLQAGATLKYGGSIAASGASGNIRTDVRNFPTTASYGFSGAVTPQSVGSGLPNTMVNMYLDKFANTNLVELAQAATVTNTLNLGVGKLDLNNFNLTMGTTTSNGTITSASANSYVVTWDGAANGNIVHHVNNNATYAFPIGDLSDYTPADLTLTGGTLTLATLSGAVIDGAHPNLGTSSNYLSRYWKIEPSGIANPFYNIVYSYATAGPTEENGIVANMWPFKHNSNGWIGCNGSGSTSMMGSGNFNPGTKTFTWNNLYSFSDFTGNGNGSPLPISLLNFDAQLVNNVVHLKWTTATEVNNDYFTIERAVNNGDFSALENIAGAGNSNEILNYMTKDFMPQNGQNYYRLKQTDFDGKYSYSEIKSIEINSSIITQPFTVYHNADNQTADISVYANDNGMVSINMYDLSGQLIYSEIKAASKGNNAWRLSTNSLSAGIYFIKVNTGDKVNTAKFIKP